VGGGSATRHVVGYGPGWRKSQLER
jgi:hypothetical protein